MPKNSSSSYLRFHEDYYLALGSWKIRSTTEHSKPRNRGFISHFSTVTFDEIVNRRIFLAKSARKVPRFFIQDSTITLLAASTGS